MHMSPPYPPSPQHALGHVMHSGRMTMYSMLLQMPGMRAGQAGLSNFGVTCFLNSMIQCLAHSPGMKSIFNNEQFQGRLIGSFTVRGDY